jgi:hypothetical protein
VPCTPQQHTHRRTATKQLKIGLTPRMTPRTAVDGSVIRTLKSIAEFAFMSYKNLAPIAVGDCILIDLASNKRRT